MCKLIKKLAKACRRKYYEMYDGCRNVFQGLHNLVVYAPIIYRTREWDHGYLTELVLFKLQRMEKVFATSCVSNRKREIKQMKHTRYLISEIQELVPNRFKAADDAIKEKYGNLTFRRVQGPLDIRSILVRAKCNTEEEQALADRESGALYEQIFEYQQKCRKRLLKHLEAYYEGWWD